MKHLAARPQGIQTTARYLLPVARPRGIIKFNSPYNRLSFQRDDGRQNLICIMRDIKINTEIAERVTLTDSNENRHNDLTPEIVAFLLSGGECIVKGKIPIYPHPRETRCPICQLKFEHIPELGYVCRPHFTRPNRYRIYVKGELIYNDEKGGTLDSYKRAN